MKTHTKRMRTPIAAAIAALWAHGAVAQDIADVILQNGTVFTVDADFSTAEAIAIKGNEIIALGSDEDMSAHKGEDTRAIDLNGATVLPGINDTHLHTLPLGFAMQSLNLTGKPLEVIRDEVAGVAGQLPPGTIINGTGWSEEALGRAPTKADLDDISPDHPVVLIEMSHHAVLLNSKALELVGFTSETQDANGVTFVRMDGSDDLSGLILEGWVLVNDKLPKPDTATRKAAIQSAIGLINSQGVTSYTEPGLTVEELEAYLELAAEGNLNARVTVHLWAGGSLDEAETVLASLPEGWSPKGQGTQDGLLNLRGLKLSLDGAPPARTAATFDDYDCCEGVRGNLTFFGDNDKARAKEIMRTIGGLHDQGYQLGIHVTGDRSAAHGIAALEAAISQNPLDPAAPMANGLRHYMIHGDRVRAEDIATMAKYNIGLSTNPLITFFAGGMVQGLWGQAFGQRHMAAGLFQDAGVEVTFGTDAPVVPANWVQGLEFAVTRTRVDGEVNGPEFAIGIEDAIRAHTSRAAFQDHQEELKGSLEVGKVADLVVFDQDFTAIDPAAISDARSLLTMVDGRIVFDALTPE